MAMPRYRYAIGQAPVRFPSLTKKEDVEKEDRGTDTATPSTGSTLAIRKQKSSTSLMPDQHRRDDTSRERLQASRKKAKSIHEPPVRRQNNDMNTPQAPKNTPRESWAVNTEAGSSRRNSLLPPPGEKTPLTSYSRGTMQQKQRPASASISCSSRPNSLFWTGPEEADTKHTQSSRLTASTSAYGSIENSKQAAANDDPYGYRALAGPSLLPTYHEQQVKLQKESEVNSRVCGPNIAYVKRNKWTIIGLAATLATLAPFCYTVLLLL